jgi:hypothetical protein
MWTVWPSSTVEVGRELALKYRTSLLTAVTKASPRRPFMGVNGDNLKVSSISIGQLELIGLGLPGKR